MDDQQVRPDETVIQLMVIITMLGTLLMAAALPEAFHERGLAFATVYVAVQVLRPLWLVLLGGERRAQLGSVHILFWAGISAVPWIARTFAHGATRLLWWTVAVGLDYTGGMLDFPTPGLGRAGLRGQAVAGEHLTERYRQLLIIAFGEAILISGIEFSPYAFERDPPRRSWCRSPSRFYCGRSTSIERVPTSFLQVRVG